MLKPFIIHLFLACTVGPPNLPVIARNYERIRERDPSRPVLLNLGQGLAWDDDIGRRSGSPAEAG